MWAATWAKAAAIPAAKEITPMKAAVVTFPGSNCDRDLAVAFERAGFEVARVWHKDSTLPQGIDVVGVPGGFSFGDYLRCGAIVLTEMQLLPGALMRNAGLKFCCKSVELRVATVNSAFTSGYTVGQSLSVPIAHHDGNYTIDAEGLRALQAEDRIAFTYAQNPNGSMADIAGVLSANRRVLGMMPHPERAADAALGGVDGAALFAGLMGGMALA
jgi:phosphoribosylformylglycinamidine synthase